MEDKKFQRAIDILLKQQAATHAGGEMTKEEQKEQAKRISVLERAVINLYNTSVKQGENLDGLSESIARQGESIARQSESIDKQGIQIDKLIAAGQHTNERLDAVIFMAEKFFSGENGKSQK